MTYSIFCFRYAKPSVLITSGLSEQQARDICRDPNTSSKTCQDPELLSRFGGTYGNEPWFFGFREEN